MIRIRFDGPPGPVAPRFVEVEDGQGRGVSVGSWEKDPESTDWFLVLSEEAVLSAVDPAEDLMDVVEWGVAKGILQVSEEQT